MKDTILVIDIETTGFLDQGGAIVEVGIVSLELQTGATEIIFDQVCREDILTGRHREAPMGWIFANSTLTVEMVREAAPLPQLLPQIQQIVNAYPLGATAYNISFDFDFLESRGLRFPKKLPCPMTVATPLCKLQRCRNCGEYKWPKVEEAWRHFFPGESYTELHRGADDALHEARIVHRLYQLGVFIV